jgi:hypothetical protein
MRRVSGGGVELLGLFAGQRGQYGPSVGVSEIAQPTMIRVTSAANAR